jgi:HlyD family secretion protein
MQRKKAFLGILAVMLVWGCRQEKTNSDAYGNFEANPVIVSSEITGKVLRFNLTEGMSIKPGAVVAVLDTTQVALKREQLVAQMAAVEAKRSTIHAQIAVWEEQIKNLETNKNRVQNMLSDGAATQQQLDDINGQINVLKKQIESTQTQFTSIQHEREVLKAQLLAVEDQISRCYVKNPVEGTVLETYIEEGELAVAGKALYKTAHTDELTLTVYVNGAQLPSVKTGQTVTVIIDKNKTENQSLQGTVTWISPQAEFTPKIIQTKEERVKLVYAVKIKVKNDGRLKIGMPGEVVF